jgi:hypothetical protein
LRAAAPKSPAERAHQAAVLDMFTRAVGADTIAIQVGGSEWDAYHVGRATSHPAPDPAVFPESSRASAL